MKIIAGYILLCLLGAMAITVLHMATSMDEHGGMSGCPFMVHEEIVCSMDLSDHLTVWKSVFQIITPISTLLAAMVSILLCIVVGAPHLSVSRRVCIQTYLRQLRERTYSFSCRPLQELFADGILHPKLF